MAILGIVIFYFPGIMGKLTGPVQSPQETPPMSDFLKSMTQEEKVKISGRSDEAIKADFAKQKEGCQKFFEITKPENMLEIDGIQSVNFAICQAIKNNDISSCDLVKGDQAALTKCQTAAKNYLDFTFPIFREKSCSLDNLSDAQKGMCDAWLFGKAEGCDKADPAGKTICLAVAKNDISVCNQLSGDSQDGCKQVYYFVKAAKENKISYLDQLKSSAEAAISKLYFDRSQSCATLLAPEIGIYCEASYSDEHLKRLLDLAAEQRIYEANKSINSQIK